MSIFQFLRIIWARRLLIVGATIACVAGAYTVAKILPPRWQADTKVMMGLLKPDPVTGQVIAGAATRAYVTTQIQLLTDYSVAGQVPDELGWLSDPGLIRAYEHRSKNDKRDFRRWLADIVISGTKATVDGGSNILDIEYTSTSPDNAKAVADALRTAYLNASLNFKRDDATRNAQWFEKQADDAAAALNAAEAAKSNFEKENHIAMADDTTDIDAARLQALSRQGVAAPAAAAPVTGPTPASLQLAKIDAEIVEAAKTLGPNHPQMLALKAQRSVLAKQAAQEEAAQKAQASAVAGAAIASADAVNRALDAATDRMVADSAKRTRLAELQNEVNLRKEQFVKTSQKAADFRQQAAIPDTGLTPLGAAVTPKAPVFPNMMLIMSGSLVLGLATGVFVALLAELFNRRVRGVEDIKSAVKVPLLAVIAAPSRTKTRTATAPRRIRFALPVFRGRGARA